MTLSERQRFEPFLKIVTIYVALILMFSYMHLYGSENDNCMVLRYNLYGSDNVWLYIGICMTMLATGWLSQLQIVYKLRLIIFFQFSIIKS